MFIYSFSDSRKIKITINVSIYEKEVILLLSQKEENILEYKLKKVERLLSEKVILMEFKDLRDVKALMVLLSQKVDKSNKYYNDFIWFSHINYTTNAEYHGEIKQFIERMINQKEILLMDEEIMDLYKWLNR